MYVDMYLLQLSIDCIDLIVVAPAAPYQSWQCQWSVCAAVSGQCTSGAAAEIYSLLGAGLLKALLKASLWFQLFDSINRVAKSPSAEATTCTCTTAPSLNGCYLLGRK